jgi:hypothetical protein
MMEREFKTGGKFQNRVRLKRELRDIDHQKKKQKYFLFLQMINIRYYIK